ncbi:MAG: tRNA pseudouridine(38-40) synthase TruA [Acidobacteria bacterium]|nr:tRNA pseudouridine(38-40) synthase TruA [Acidobacteriota bacterium]
MPERRNHRIDVAYVGTRYHGWQVQPDRVTVQSLLEQALSTLYQEKVALAGAGRTDAGVHARRQTANYTAPGIIPPPRVPDAVNGLIPRDVRVLGARFVQPGFHARKSARGKVYRYTLYTGRVCPPFRADFAWHFRRTLDLDAMAQAGALLVGRHDFTSFCARVEGEADRVRTVTSLRLTRSGPLLYLWIEADGFLHHMVRNIVGTLVDVGCGKRSAGDTTTVLAARDRRAAGPTAPPQGLELVRVRY